MKPSEEFKTGLKDILDDMARVVADRYTYGEHSPLYECSNRIFDRDMDKFLERWLPKDE